MFDRVLDKPMHQALHQLNLLRMIVPCLQKHLCLSVSVSVSVSVSLSLALSLSLPYQQKTEGSLMVNALELQP